jgi:hypothetical protein
MIIPVLKGDATRIRNRTSSGTTASASRRLIFTRTKDMPKTTSRVKISNNMRPRTNSAEGKALRPIYDDAKKAGSYGLNELLAEAMKQGIKADDAIFLGRAWLVKEKRI